MPDIDLNPDGPHSPEHTREAGQLFDDVSRFLCYATMGDKGGLKYPADAYALIADLYSATGRFSQVCEQLDGFLARQAATGRLYEARGRDITDQLYEAAAHLVRADEAAQNFAREMQAVQAAIAGLGVKEDGDVRP